MKVKIQVLHLVPLRGERPDFFSPSNVPKLYRQSRTDRQCDCRAFVPLCLHVIGKALTFGFLALMALEQGIFTWLFVPETKNKRLEEIEDYWGTSKHIVSVRQSK